MSNTPTYRSWQSMRDRCKKTGVQYKHYSGKGVTVCKRWESFENFLADMGERPVGTSLDRINVKKGYSKSNCRWATNEEQARNRGNNNVLQGKTLSEWSLVLNIPRSTLAQRLYVYGWSVERTLNTPVRKKRLFVNPKQK